MPGSEGMFTPRWSPDGRLLVANRMNETQPTIYEFATKTWLDVDLKVFGFQRWSKDSKYGYGLWQAQNCLVRIEVATRTVEQIRSIKEFRLTGTMGVGVSWTPDKEPVVLVDHSTREIYRIEVER